MFKLIVALISLLAKEVSSVLLQDPELIGGYFQGDIVEPIRSRNGIANPQRNWPNGVVYYHIEENAFGVRHYAEILRAFSIIEENSCVFFKKSTEEERKKSILITSKAVGCHAIFVGFRNNSYVVNLGHYPLGFGCFRIGSILHELLHALGFEHQHVAQDRDEYISIQWENIIPEFKINFINNDTTTKWHSFGESYDYDSVMHYVPTAFSKNGKPTIVALKDGASNMGQRWGMSAKDIRKLNKMYKCPGYV
ncbi:seminal metalloprotease 1 [Drosophila ficusphila]|uniref:seminal metalloprotease 1 n=1 Tax=Drosophila ficusphila TaxID=30025 RepID=UPI001C8919AE|nr:seminal metalloprotease 1 [Drosophila ficusphila]